MLTHTAPSLCCASGHACWAGPLAAAAVLLAAGPAAADGGSTAPANFGFSCAGCHMGGGNVTAPGATLRLEDLQRNGFADGDALYALIYSGRGKMPGFGQDCAPKVRGYGARAAHAPCDSV